MVVRVCAHACVSMCVRVLEEGGDAMLCIYAARMPTHKKNEKPALTLTRSKKFHLDFDEIMDIRHQRRASVGLLVIPYR